MELKLNQHYVPRFYLEKWGKEKKKKKKKREIGVPVRQFGKISVENTRNVGAERKLYVPSKVSEAGKQILLNVLNKHPADLLAVTLKIYEKFIFEGDVIANKGQLTEKEFASVHNSGEDFHCQIEDAGKEYLTKLFDGDDTFYSLEQARSNFNLYVAAQYFRTPRMRNGFVNMESTMKLLGAEVEGVWLTSSFIYSVALSRQLSIEPFKLYLLSRSGDECFITGDQPVVNTFNVGRESFSPNEGLELYHPISPDKAVLITKSPKVVTTLKDGEVRAYNKMIADQSVRQLFASSIEQLANYSI